MSEDGQTMQAEKLDEAPEIEAEETMLRDEPAPEMHATAMHEPEPHGAEPVPHAGGLVEADPSPGSWGLFLHGGDAPNLRGTEEQCRAWAAAHEMWGQSEARPLD